MSAHTKEPWIVSGTGGIRYVEAKVGNGMIQEVASCMAAEFGDMEANASRIVDCVNYCAGIPGERMESDFAQGVNAKDQIYAYDSIRAQRDELLAALKLAQRALSSLASKENRVMTNLAIKRAIDKAEAA